MLKKLPVLRDLKLPGALGLRQTQAEDQQFLQELFGLTRSYLYQLPLPKAQLELLVMQQFLLQQSSYAKQFPNAENFIIEQQQLAIGKLLIDQADQHLRLVDIALLPAHSGQGVGNAIVSALQQISKKRQCSIKLSGDNQNARAKKFYLALGFRVVSASTTHESMEWRFD